VDSCGELVVHIVQIVVHSKEVIEMKLATLLLMLAIAAPAVAQSAEFMLAIRKADLAVNRVKDHYYDSDWDEYQKAYSNAEIAVDNATAIASTKVEKKLAKCEDTNLFLINQTHKSGGDKELAKDALALKCDVP
jgi:hypothetical protein